MNLKVDFGVTIFVCARFNGGLRQGQFVQL